MPVEEQTGPAAGPEPESQESVPERPQLDPELEARRRAALALVRTFGDPVLRTKALEVTRFDENLATEVARMGHIMDEAMGLGLAATQLGIMHRVLVYRTGPGAPLVAVVNPRLEWSSQEEETAEEGCLSLPGVVLDVDRPVHVRLTAHDPHGDEMLIEASGLDARVVQHEMDHLDGVLILDHTDREQRNEALRILREGVSPPDGPEDGVPASRTAGNGAGS
jgi:peptide deformylase